MITVHHLEHSRSQRILWLLEELGLPYTVKRYARDPSTLLAPPELKAVHPLGKSPVISDGALTVAESGAIIEHLLDRAAPTPLKPAAGTPERQRFTFWLHFAEGSAMPYLVMKLVFEKVRSAPAPFFVKPILKGVAAQVNRSFIEPNLQAQLAYMNSEVARDGWFAGAGFTAADVQMSYPVEAAAASGGLAASHPALADWLQRIHARPAYQRALATGGPYQVVPR